jgi:hypothetical protein
MPVFSYRGLYRRFPVLASFGSLEMAQAIIGISFRITMYDSMLPWEA